MSITKIKRHLQSIITNIKDLESFEAGAEQTVELSLELQEQIIQTDNLLNELENIDLNTVNKTISKRKRKRKRFKYKKRSKQKILFSKRPSNIINNETNLETNIPHLFDSKLKSLGDKPHHYLRNIHNAKRFLRTFELLKLLHLERSQNPESTAQFSYKLQNLITIWNNILQENISIQNTPEAHIQDQWLISLFGISEKKFLSKSCTLKDFIKIRLVFYF